LDRTRKKASGDQRLTWKPRLKWESARSSLRLYRASLKSTPHRAGPSEEQHSQQSSGSNVTDQLHEHSPDRLSTSQLVQSLRSRSILRTNPLGLGNIFTWVSSRIPIQTTPQIFNILQLYRPPRPVTEIALLFLLVINILYCITPCGSS
jgi:hypothetical protein